jgi:hypothetical protein
VVAACSRQQDGADSAPQGAGSAPPTLGKGSPPDIPAGVAATDPDTVVEGGGGTPPQASDPATTAAAGSGVGGEAGGGVAPVRAAGCWQLWQADPGVLGEGWVEYIPGRDTVLTPCELATGETGGMRDRLCRQAAGAAVFVPSRLALPTPTASPAAMLLPPIPPLPHAPLSHTPLPQACMSRTLTPAPTS